MQTRPDRMYDPKQLEADVRELYRTELFSRVETSVRETDEGVYVQIKIKEHLLVSEVIFHGNERLDDRRLKNTAALKKAIPSILIQWRWLANAWSNTTKKMV